MPKTPRAVNWFIAGDTSLEIGWCQRKWTRWRKKRWR